MEQEAVKQKLPYGMITTECEKNTITVTSYENRQIAGYFYNGFLDCGAYFTSEMQIIWLAENLLDAMAFPQCGVEYRKFDKPKRARAKRVEGSTMKEMVTKMIDAPEALNGKATFVIQVQFRQNATWQGTLQWVERGETRRFRSTLEMLMLMDEALNNVDDESYRWSDNTKE